MTRLLADVSRAAPLLVFSHLRWGEHWQRPQQLFARFAQHREVLFVEPPRFLDDISRPALEHTVPYPGVHRVVTRLPVTYRTNDTVAYVTMRTLLMDLLGPYGPLAHRFEQPVVWFATPMPAPTMVGAFDERLIVYDPMPPEMARSLDDASFHVREALLLRYANLVLTDLELGAAIGRHRALLLQSAGCTDNLRPHRTTSAWDTLATDIDQLLREITASGRSARPDGTATAIPGWAAAQATTTQQRSA